MKQCAVPIEEMKPLAPFCTFGIGGPARYFATSRTLSDLQQLIQWANNRGISFFTLGKGSNLLFDDRGYNGLVIYNRIAFLEELNPSSFYVGSGYSFARLGAMTARKGLAGLEFASGIPGSVGGAVYMNAGANGGETADCLEEVDYIDAEGHRKQLKRSELDFSYRSSSFQKWNGAIAAARFSLVKGEQTLQKQRELLAYRLETQPYEDKSAGCVFRNPQNKGAGALIDAAGLKGYSIGGAAISQKHANFIINKGHATAEDVKRLIQEIKKKVGFDLECELRIIPFKEEQ